MTPDPKHPDPRQPTPDDPRRPSPKDPLRRRRERYREMWERLKHERQRAWTPWLLSRYKLTDLGLRPIHDGEPFWISPDILVESSDPWGRAVAGEANHLHARVFNLGKADAVPTRVDFYWANPALGLDAAHMNYIGTEWVEVAAHTVRDVRCSTPWFPLFVNGGHECVEVIASAPILDPATHPFEPKRDRHVGQRNLTVLEGQAGDVLDFHLAVHNLLPLTLGVTIAVRVDHLALTEAGRAAKLRPRLLLAHVAGFEDAERAAFAQAGALRALRGGPDRRQEPALATALARQGGGGPPLLAQVSGRGTAQVAASWSGESFFQAMAGDPAGVADRFGGQRAAAGPLCDTREQVVQEARLRPGEQRGLRLRLVLPGAARPGEFLAFHLLQRADGWLLGGYTVVVAVRGRPANG